MATWNEPLLHRHADGTEHAHPGSEGFSIGGQVIVDRLGDEPHSHSTLSIVELAGDAPIKPRSGPVVWSERLGDIAHVLTDGRVPYAEAGFEKGLATKTCPACGRTLTERDQLPDPMPEAWADDMDDPHKRASAAYHHHFTTAATEEGTT